MDDLLTQLRDANVDDVEQALDGSYVEDLLEGIAPDVLLEFFLRMIGRIAGEDET